MLKEINEQPNSGLRFTPKKIKGWWYIIDTNTDQFVAKRERDGVLRAVRKKSSKAVVDMIVHLERSVL